MAKDWLKQEGVWSSAAFMNMREMSAERLVLAMQDAAKEQESAYRVSAAYSCQSGKRGLKIQVFTRECELSVTEDIMMDVECMVLEMDCLEMNSGLVLLLRVMRGHSEFMGSLLEQLFIKRFVQEPKPVTTGLRTNGPGAYSLVRPDETQEFALPAN